MAHRRGTRARAVARGAVRAESGAHADSPLKLTEIIARPKVVDLKVSPDGRYFAGTAVTDDGKTILHILDRKTMSVVHSEVYEGPLGVGEFDLARRRPPADHLELQERAGRGAGQRRRFPPGHQDEGHPPGLGRRRLERTTADSRAATWAPGSTTSTTGSPSVRPDRPTPSSRTSICTSSTSSPVARPGS